MSDWVGVAATEDLLALRSTLVKYSPDQERVPAGSPEGGEFAGSSGPLDVPDDEMSYPGGFNPNDVSMGPLTANEKLYWVAASRERLQAVRDHALVPGTLGNKFLMGMMLDQGYTTVPIYRGIRWKAGADAAYDLATYQRSWLVPPTNHEVDLQLSSFTTDKAEALLYARNEESRTSGQGSKNAFLGSALIEVAPGAAGYNIGPTFRGNPGDEVITAGRYEVRGVGNRLESTTTKAFDGDITYSGSIPVVSLKQVGVVDAQSGKSWEATDWADFAGAAR